jgi:hypothetical protein
METGHSSETSASFYQATQRNVLEMSTILGWRETNSVWWLDRTGPDCSGYAEQQDYVNLSDPIKPDICCSGEQLLTALQCTATSFLHKISKFTSQTIAQLWESGRDERTRHIAGTVKSRRILQFIVTTSHKGHLNYCSALSNKDRQDHLRSKSLLQHEERKGKLLTFRSTYSLWPVN